MSGPVERGDVTPLRWATYGDMTDAERRREILIAAADAERWWEVHENLAALVNWLAETTGDVQQIAHVVEKPWHYTAEFVECMEAS